MYSHAVLLAVMSEYCVKKLSVKVSGLGLVLGHLQTAQTQIRCCRMFALITGS